VKLFIPDMLNGWSFVERPIWDPIALLVPSVVPGIGVALKSYLWGIAHRNSGGKGAVYIFLATTASLIAMFIWRGRQTLPCPWNSDACSGIHPTKQLCCTQAHLYTVAILPALSACMSTTPQRMDAADGFRFQVDLAMHRCLTSSFTA
jgi:hypothetical protein